MRARSGSGGGSGRSHYFRRRGWPERRAGREIRDIYANPRYIFSVSFYAKSTQSMMTVSEVLTAIFVGFQVARFFFLVSRFASRHLVVSLVVSRVWCGVLSPLVSVSRPSLAARAIVRQPQSSVPTSFLSSPASPRSTSGTTLTTRTARTNRKRRLCAVRRSLFTVQVRLRKDLSLYNTNYKQETKDLAGGREVPACGRPQLFHVFHVFRRSQGRRASAIWS